MKAKHMYNITQTQQIYTHTHTEGLFITTGPGRCAGCSASAYRTDKLYDYKRQSMASMMGSHSMKTNFGCLFIKHVKNMTLHLATSAETL